MLRGSLYRFGVRAILAALLVMAGAGAALGQVVAVALPSSAQASAADTAATPRQLIEQTIPQVIEVLRDKSLTGAQRAEKIDAVLRECIDFSTLSRLTLGKAWETLSQEQREAFTKELSSHLMRVYLPLTHQYSGQNVAVTKESPASGGDHTVLTTITDQKGGAVRQVATISCRLRRVDTGWRVIDLTVEGISVARVFASQFRPVLEQEGFDGLLERLRKKAQSTSAPK